MKKITASFIIVTPMFLGGGNENQAATGIRPPSLKGALRFWWRAHKWAALFKKYQNSQQALSQLHAEEAFLFGAAAKERNEDATTKPKLGQSQFIIRLVSDTSRDKATTELFGKSGCHYLLGQGLYHFKKQIQRSYLPVNKEFTVQLAVKASKNDEKIIQELQLALKTFGLLGGLGSRARRGFGSIALTKLTDPNGNDVRLPNSKEEYIQEVRQLFSSGNSLDALPPFTAFSGNAQSDLSETSNSWQSLLDIVGSKMQIYRSWGQGGKVDGKTSLQRYKHDHDTMRRAALEESDFSQPERLVFGVPHNYFFSSANNAKLDISFADDDSKSRRASPLFIHIHQINNEYFAVQSLFPAVFFPDKAKVQYLPKNKRAVSERAPEPVNWQVIRDYLELKTYEGENKTARAEGFIRREVIYPG